MIEIGTANSLPDICTLCEKDLKDSEPWEIKEKDSEKEVITPTQIVVRSPKNSLHLDCLIKLLTDAAEIRK